MTKEEVGEVILIIGLIVCIVMMNVTITEQLKQIAARLSSMEEQVLKVEEQLGQLERDIRKIHGWLDAWKVEEWEATAYAPLDPKAKEGMCYSGNPRVTASGEKVMPGVTAAAGCDIPFGTPIYIEGIGWRIVQDRGGRISPGCVDIAVNTLEEAMRFGRRKVMVMYPNG